MRRPCPGVGTIPGTPADGHTAYCPCCRGIYRQRDDGTVGWHPMRYERLLAAAAEALSEHERRHGSIYQQRKGTV